MYEGDLCQGWKRASRHWALYSVRWNNRTKCKNATSGFDLIYEMWRKRHNATWLRGRSKMLEAKIMDLRKAWACLMPAAAVIFPYKRDNKSHAKKQNPIWPLWHSCQPLTTLAGLPKVFAPWLREIFGEIKKRAVTFRLARRWSLPLARVIPVQGGKGQVSEETSQQQPCH